MASTAAAPIPTAGTTAVQPGRYRQILIFFAGLAWRLIIWDIILVRLWPGYVRRRRPQRFRQLAGRFREMAVTLGGVMIKLGQFLSARVDVLPPEITEELADLQDEALPVAWPEIQAVLESELGDLSARFHFIEPVPVAAASLGQAHRAWLPAADAGGERGPAVIIKVQRPGIVDLVRTDLAALQVVARWLMRYPALRRRANVPALMDEFGRTLWEELDYQAEAANAERFAALFAADATVCIPAIFRPHSTGRVLVLEDVAAIKITDLAAMREAGIDPARVPPRLLDTYFRQIFQEGFFHADPHPGNLFIIPDGDTAAAPRPFRLAFVDFGMVGRIPDETRQELRQLLLSITQRDTVGMTAVLDRLGFFLPDADLARIAEAQAALLDLVWGRNLLEMAHPDPREVQALSRAFRDILFDFPFQAPQQFIYLGRAMGMLSGLASRLDPQINPWRYVEKYGRELIRQESGQQVSGELLLSWLRPLLTLPGRLDRLLHSIESGQLHLPVTPDRTTSRRLDRLEQRLRQLNWGLVAVALILSGAWLYTGELTAMGIIAWLLAGLIIWRAW